MTADSGEGLRMAMEELNRNPPPALTRERHPMSFRLLDEFYGQRDAQQQGESTNPA